MVKWLKIDVMIESSEKTPFFVGSMFRGALGVALKRVVCINPSYKCEGCFSAKKCVYHQFYEEKNVFHAYRLGIEMQPDNYDFSLYLFEDAVDTLPYMLSSIQKAAQEQGFGSKRKQMKVRQISINNTIVYNGKDFLTLEQIEANQLTIDSFCPNIELEFIMPLRIKENNRFAREHIGLYTLVNNIHNKYRQLKGEAREKMKHKIEGEIITSNLKFVDMQRYSNRQKKGMSMGGLKGTMTIEGLDPRSYEYLKIGEILGAGKQTVFGLGSYRIKPFYKR